MAGRSTFRMVLRRAGPPAALLIVAAFFGGYAVMGPNGALAYGDIERELVQRERQLAMLEKCRSALQNQVDLLNRLRASPDLAEELVRRELKLVHSDELVLMLDSTDLSPAEAGEKCRLASARGK